MTELNDQELLAQYARTYSEPAFAALVARYVNLVYSAALRFTGNPHHAQEITQAVFIIFARKAGSLGRTTVLSGWLYQTARLTAANFVKGEIRRQQREQEAYMQSTSTEPDCTAWEQIAPLLDEAMGKLGETDRNAILLRFFENKTAHEIAATLNLNEATAHKRVSRALEKLRKYFVTRGVTLSATLIAGAVAANSVQAAPVGLAVTVTAAAAKGSAVSISITTLVKGTLGIMTYLKLKSALVTATVVVAVGAGLYEAHEVATLRDQVQTLQQQQAPLEGKIQQLNRERDDATNRLGTLAEELAKAKVNDRELIKLRGEVGVLRAKVGVAKNKAVQPIAAPQPTASAGHRPGVYIEKDQLAFAGYATPEATMETLTWAAINGAYDQLIEGVGREDQVRFTREQVETQSQEVASALKGMRIVSKKILADDKVEIKFHVDASEFPDDKLVPRFEIQPMVKVGNGWKIVSNGTRTHENSWEETGEIQTFAP